MPDWLSDLEKQRREEEVATNARQAQSDFYYQRRKEREARRLEHYATVKADIEPIFEMCKQMTKTAVSLLNLKVSAHEHDTGVKFGRDYDKFGIAYSAAGGNQATGWTDKGDHTFTMQLLEDNTTFELSFYHRYPFLDKKNRHNDVHENVSVPATQVNREVIAECLKWALTNEGQPWRTVRQMTSAAR